jgi:hypothetical protein
MGRDPAELRVQENEKMLKLLGVGQPDRDQPVGIDWQAPVLGDDRCVTFRGANHTFDGPAVEQKRLEAELAHFRLGELYEHSKSARYVNRGQAWAPDARFDIFRIGLSDIVDNQACHLIDRHPRPTCGKLYHRLAYRLSQKADRHPPGGHPIAQAALQRAEVPIDFARGAQGVNWFHQLRTQRPVRFEFASDSEGMMAKRCVDSSAYLFLAIAGVGEHADQRRPGLVNREAMKIDQMQGHCRNIDQY